MPRTIRSDAVCHQFRGLLTVTSPVRRNLLGAVAVCLLGCTQPEYQAAHVASLARPRAPICKPYVSSYGIGDIVHEPRPKAHIAASACAVGSWESQAWLSCSRRVRCKRTARAVLSALSYYRPCPILGPVPSCVTHQVAVRTVTYFLLESLTNCQLPSPFGVHFLGGPSQLRTGWRELWRALSSPYLQLCMNAAAMHHRRMLSFVAARPHWVHCSWVHCRPKFSQS